ncbi:MAG: c-type cytochrome [bacterium]
MKQGFILAVISGVLASNVGFAAGDVEAGRKLASNCMGCHGVPSYNNVYPTYRVPRLGGQHPEYIVAALQAYAKGDRPHETMHAQAATLSETDMQNLAAYLSSLGPK